MYTKIPATRESPRGIVIPLTRDTYMQRNQMCHILMESGWQY